MSLDLEISSPNVPRLATSASMIHESTTFGARSEWMQLFDTSWNEDPTRSSHPSFQAYIDEVFLSPWARKPERVALTRHAASTFRRTNLYLRHGYQTWVNSELMCQGTMLRPCRARPDHPRQCSRCDQGWRDQKSLWQEGCHSKLQSLKPYIKYWYLSRMRMCEPRTLHKMQRPDYCNCQFHEHL